MSDKPSILEGGSSRNFNPVDVLDINKQSNGRSTWVLADSVEVGSLDASKNGLYLAIEDDYFAYDQIVVNVSDDLADADDATKATNKIVGKDPDLDPNNDYAVGLDEDGNLTKEMIPAAIHIVVPPRKLKYEEGETINFDGIHVYLMDGNNHRYTDSNYPTGEIPFGELIFPVTVATSSETYDYYTASLDGYPSITYVVTSSWYEPVMPGISQAELTETFSAPCRMFWIGDKSLIFSETEFTITIKYKQGHDEWGGTVQSSVVTTFAGKRVYWYDINNGVYEEEIVNQCTPIVPYNDISLPNPFYQIVASILYDGKSEKEGESGVPVQWMRSDGEILEDTFEIEVGESEPPLPPQPDPWAGYADVSWNGHHYNFNRRLVPPVQYSNGYCWRQQAGEYIVEYTVEQAASMGWLILIR